MSATDLGPTYDLLINPPKEPPAWMMRTIDALSIALPVLAAVLSVGAGAAALNKADAWVAWLGIVAGVAGALGVLFTGWASRVRDQRLEMAKAVGWLGLDAAGQASSQNPSAF